MKQLFLEENNRNWVTNNQKRKDSGINTTVQPLKEPEAPPPPAFHVKRNDVAGIPAEINWDLVKDLLLSSMQC